jgi:hypothetical protein
MTLLGRNVLPCCVFSRNLSRAVCPPGFSGRPIGEGARSRASLLFSTTINTSPPPSSLSTLLRSFPIFLLPVPSSARSARLDPSTHACAARSSYPLLHLPVPFGLAAADATRWSIPRCICDDAAACLRDANIGDRGCSVSNAVSMLVAGEITLAGI